jgi:hypothetical protein
MREWRHSLLTVKCKCRAQESVYIARTIKEICHSACRRHSGFRYVWEASILRRRHVHRPRNTNECVNVCPPRREFTGLASWEQNLPSAFSQFHSRVFNFKKSQRFHLLVSFCGRLWFPLIKSTITLFLRVKMWQQNVSLMLSHRKMFRIGVSPCFWEIRNCRSYVVVVICEQYISKLAPWNLVLLVKPPVVQLFKTFWKQYGTRKSLLSSQESFTSPYPEAVESSPFQPMLSVPISSLILSTHPYLGLTSDFPAFPPISYMVYSTFVLHAITISFSLTLPYNYAWRRVQVMKLFIMQFSPLSRPLLFGPNILISTLFLNILSLCSFFNARDQVLHPCRTIGKHIVLCILIFTFLDNQVFFMKTQFICHL